MRWACSVDGSEASCSLERQLDAVRAAGCDVVMERTLAASDEMTNLAAGVEADRQEAVANVIRLVETAAKIGAAVVRLAPANVGPPGGPPGALPRGLPTSVCDRVMRSKPESPGAGDLEDSRP